MKNIKYVILNLVILALVLACQSPVASGNSGPSSSKDLTSFGFSSPSAVGVISGTNITVSVPGGTDLTNLVANFVSTGSYVTIGNYIQTSGTTANNFTSPVTYTVTAEDKSFRTYTVTVTSALSTTKDLTAFAFVSPSVSGTITGTNIAVTVPSGTAVNALVATFTTNGISVKVGSTVQISGTTPNNFTSPVSYTVTAGDSSTKVYTVTVTVAPSTSKSITAFGLSSPFETGSIVGTAISLSVPHGTAVTSLIATFTTTGASVSVGSTTQISGTTPNDFSNPVVYKVTAGDGTSQTYTVTVTVVSSSTKDLTSFSFASPAATGVITGTNIAITVPYATNVSALVASFSSTGSLVQVGSVTQTTGVTANDFTNPVSYTVTAADASTKVYTVTVTVALSPFKDITAFSLVSPAEVGTISGTNISVAVPVGTSLSSLVATFTVSAGASVQVGSTSQVSGTTPNNFASPVAYKVTAADGTTKTFTVTVSIFYSVTYYGTGSTSGSPPADSTQYAAGGTVTVLGAGSLVNAPGATFNLAGWNTKSDGTGVSHAVGSTFGITSANVSLYPVWVSSTLNFSSSGTSIVITGYPFASTPSGVLTITPGVTGIAANAFTQVTGLTGVTLPSSLTSIGSAAFFGCTGLTSISYPANLTSVAPDAFLNCSHVSSYSVDAANPAYSSAGGVLFNKAGDTLLAAPPQLTGTYAIPTGVVTVGPQAFQGCANLTSVSFSATVTTLGDFAFSGANLGYSVSPVTVVLPSGITTIGRGVFSYNIGMTSISIPDTVTSIGTDQFLGCFALTAINVSSGNAFYQSVNGALLDKAGLTLMSVPAGFTGTSGAWTVPATVTAIDLDAFSHSNLTSLTLPAGLTGIGAGAFAYSSLASLTIPATVGTIGNSAFGNCLSLTTINLLPTTPPLLSAASNAFQSDFGFTIHVPSTSLSAYQAATGWSVYSANITAP